MTGMWEQVAKGVHDDLAKRLATRVRELEQRVEKDSELIGDLAAIGIEIEERYCELAVSQLKQGTLDLQEAG